MEVNEALRFLYYYLFILFFFCLGLREIVHPLYDFFFLGRATWVEKGIWAVARAT